jgi:hypothetical protein
MTKTKWILAKPWKRFIFVPSPAPPKAQGAVSASALAVWFTVFAAISFSAAGLAMEKGALRNLTLTLPANQNAFWGIYGVEKATKRQRV